MKKKIKADYREEAEVKKEAKVRFEELENQKRDIRARRFWRRWTGAG